MKHDPEAVFFDVFDTLILRSVHPEDVKRIAARRFVDYLADTTSPESFYELRARLEPQLCEDNLRAGFDFEFRLGTLASRMETEVGDRWGGFSEEFLRVEEAAELAVQRLDDAVAELLRKLRAEGRRICLVSDFYLLRSSLERFAAELGVSDYVDAVFTSSDFLLTKRTGQLYDRVLREEAITPNRVVMVGDNRHSDFDMARAKGLSAVHIDRAGLMSKYQELHERNTARNAVLGAVLPGAGASPRPLFLTMSHTLYHFTARLLRAARRRKLENLFFLSREGQPLKRAFDTLQALEPTGNTIRTHYLKVSRRSTFLPSLRPLEQEDFDTLFRQYRAISLNDFLGSLGFEENLIGRVQARFDVDPEAKLADFPTSSLYEAVRADSLFVESYETRRREQRSLLEEYIEGFEGAVHRDGMYLVDVGWKGTIQDHLHRFLDAPVHGFYMGLVAPGACSPRNSKEGLLFSTADVLTVHSSIYDQNRALFEVLLAADHGSTRGYVRKDGRAVPETAFATGEEEIVVGQVLPVLRGIEAEFVRIAETLSVTPFDILDFEQDFVEAHAELALFPRREEVEFFTRINHHENFGLLGTSHFHAEAKPTLKRRLSYLRRILRKPRTPLEEGWWFRATLANEGLPALGGAYGLYHYLRWRKAFESWP
jgi:HAD superfamily hydrolase (TIGR01549 family)